MKRIFAGLFLVVACTSVLAQSEEDTLLVLADQTFTQLHNEYVSLPTMFSERVARSLDRLPPGWPSGEMKGLVKKEFIEQAFLSAGLAGLDAGQLFIFHKLGEYELFVFLQRNQGTGVVEARRLTACAEGACYSIGTPLACGSDDGEDIECTCSQTPCQQCVDGNGNTYFANYDEEGNLTAMESADDGTMHDVCSDPPGNTIIISN